MDAQFAAMEEYGDELQRETLRCENSTAEAICGAQNAQKLSELYSGLEVWKKALCTLATRYSKTCFELGRRNMDDLGGKKPADFAYERAATGLSLFLRVSALDGKEENCDGRVREFIRHVCGGWSDLAGNFSDLLGDSAPTVVFQLPWWAVPRGIGARVLGSPMIPPNGDESSTLGIEKSKTLILGAESSLTAALRAVLLRSHRKALIATGMSTSSRSKQEPLVAPMATDMEVLSTASEVEHLDTLSRLNKLFGSELWKAKADTSAAAFESLRAIDTDGAKRDELGKHLLAWRERVAAAIHKWVGKYFALARSNLALAGRTGKWVEEQMLSRLQAQCIGYEGRSTFTKDGVTYLEPLEWWLRCACDGKPRLPERPWDPPDWIVPVYDSQLLHHASLTRDLMSELNAAIVDASQVSNDPKASDRTAGRIVIPTPENKFEREGEVWTIAFAGETCRLPASLIGLDYISVLLRYAGASIGAQQLRAQRAAAVPVDPKYIKELQSDPTSNEKPNLQTDFSPHDVLDAETRAQYENEVRNLEVRISFEEDSGNKGEVERLEKEKTFIEKELVKQRGIPGRPRRFADQKESARSTVTHAIKHAFRKIEKSAPATAQHLRDNIATGTFLTYRDCSVRWKT